MSDSSIVIGKDHTTFIGEDATLLYSVMVLRSAIGLHRKTGMIPTRGVTITSMLLRAGQITGKRYAGQGKHLRAEADLTTFIENLKASLPIEETR